MSVPTTELTVELNKLLDNFKEQNVSNIQAAVNSLSDKSAPKSRKMLANLRGHLTGEPTELVCLEDGIKLKRFAEFLEKCCEIEFRKKYKLSAEQETLLEGLRNNLQSDWVENKEVSPWKSLDSKESSKPEVEAPARFATQTRGVGILSKRILEEATKNGVLQQENSKLEKEIEMYRKYFGLKRGVQVREADLEKAYLEKHFGTPVPNIAELKLALELKKVMEKSGLRVDSAKNLEVDIKQLKDKASESDKLKQENDLLKKENADLRGKLEAALKQIESLTLQLKNMTAERDALKAQLDQVTKQLKDMTAERDKYKAESEKFARERDALKVQLEQLGKQLQAMTAERDKYKAESEKLAKERDALKAQLEQIAKEKAKVDADLAKAMQLLAQPAPVQAPAPAPIVHQFQAQQPAPAPQQPVQPPAKPYVHETWRGHRQ